jgi:hypothetical protein
MRILVAVMRDLKIHHVHTQSDGVWRKSKDLLMTLVVNVDMHVHVRFESVALMLRRLQARTWQQHRWLEDQCGGSPEAAKHANDVIQVRV